MTAHTRVPGAASSEVDFELERFERTAENRIEIAGRWYGLRGRRFVRPVLHLHAAGTRRRAIALLEHKPWAADDGETWLAAFAWPAGTGEVEGAELEVGPGLVVALPALGEASGRVSALRPHVPAVPGLAERARRGEEQAAGTIEAGRAEARTAGWTPPPRRDAVNAAQAERDEAMAARDDAERERLKALGERDDALSRRDAALRDVDRANAERETAIAERDRVQAELERITRERDHAYAERSRMMQDAEAVQRERDQLAAERDAARNELSRLIPSRELALKERDAEAVRADRAESERDTAYAERKTAVAQRDRARRERDRAMRAAGVEPPAEGPYAGVADARGAASEDDPDAVRTPAQPRPADGAGTLPGTAIPSRPVKRIGGGAYAAQPESKPLLTPVDGSRPRRLSRTRRSPGAPARMMVRVLALVLLLAVALVAVALLTSLL